MFVFGNKHDKKFVMLKNAFEHPFLSDTRGFYDRDLYKERWSPLRCNFLVLAVKRAKGETK